MRDSSGEEKKFFEKSFMVFFNGSFYGTQITARLLLLFGQFSQSKKYDKTVFFSYRATYCKANMNYLSILAF